KSQISVDAVVQLAANFRAGKLTEFQSVVTGTLSFEVDVHARSTAAADVAGSVPVVTPVHRFYGTLIGGVPVWIEVVFELNLGFAAHVDAPVDVADGVTGAK